MKFDIITEEFIAPNELARIGLIAEEYGIRGIWTSNYLSSRDPIMNLYPLAQASSKIMMGPLAVSPWELHPLKLLNAMNTLNEVSDGRAMVHLSGGGGDWWMGTGNEPYKRVGCVKDTANILMGAKSPGENFNYNGRQFRARNHHPKWVKHAPPKVYVGAMKPQMLKMAGKTADGMMFSDFPACLIPQSFDIVNEGRAEAGRLERPFSYSNFWALHVHEDPAVAQQEATRELILRGWLEPTWLRPFLTEEEVQLVQDRKYDFLAAWQQGLGEVPDFPKDVIDRIIQGITSTGSFDEAGRIIQQFREFERVGCTEVAIRVHDNAEAAIRFIGEQLIPSLEREAA